MISPEPLNDRILIIDDNAVIHADSDRGNERLPHQTFQS